MLTPQTLKSQLSEDSPKKETNGSAQPVWVGQEPLHLTPNPTPGQGFEFGPLLHDAVS